MDIAFYTNKGPNRPDNQDGLYIAGSIYNSLENPERLTTSAKSGLYAVVDGLGGHAGGEIAAQLTLEGLDDIEGESQCHTLDLGLNKIQHKLHLAGQGPNISMGATLAGIWLGAGKAIAFNCGDCRVYQYGDGNLQKLTHDHSLVQELVDAGELAEDQMRFHPRKNIVTSGLIANMPDPDIFCRSFLYREQYIYFICSDGIWEALDEDEIITALSGKGGDMAMAIVRQLWQNKASDNVSFIIISQ